MIKKQLKKEVEAYKKSIKYQDEEISIHKAFLLGLNKVGTQKKGKDKRKRGLKVYLLS